MGIERRGPTRFRDLPWGRVLAQRTVVTGLLLALAVAAMPEGHPAWALWAVLAFLALWNTAALAVRWMLGRHGRSAREDGSAPWEEAGHVLKGVTPDGDREPGGLRVFRISHSAVVTAWRERERILRRRGVDVVLVTAARWPEGGSTVEFRADGDDQFAIPVRTWGTHPNAFLFDPRPLWHLLGDSSWDLIDLHEEPFGLAVAEVLILRWLRGRTTPFLVSSAQNIYKLFPPPFRWIERWSLRHAAGAYTCNVEAGRILRRKGLRGELALVPLGVDLSRFQPADREPPRDRLRVGFVGRLVRVKGAAVLLEAVALDSRLEAHLYGGGSDADHLRAQAAALGIADRVTLHGHVDESVLPVVFPTFDVLAVPSIPVPGALEQFGRVVVEAHASGVPVVASECGALPEVVGVGGLLVPPGDPGALCAALVGILEHPGRWTALRETGRTEVERFSWTRVADLTQDLYESAAERPVTVDVAVPNLSS